MDRENVDQDEPSVSTFLGSVIFFGAVVGFTSSSFLEYVDASLLALAGFAFGLGGATVWNATRRGWGRRWAIPYGVAFLLGVILLAYQANTGVNVYQANKARCAALQEDMLQMAPRRHDSDDLFVALRCVPHGYGVVQFPGEGTEKTVTTT